MRFTIGRKIGAGFAVLIIFTTIAFLLTITTLSDSKSKTTNVVGQLAPSVSELKELNLLIQRSGTYITQWMFNSSTSSDIEFRQDLQKLIQKDYPNKKDQILELSKSWSDEEQKKLKSIFLRVESIFRLYKSDIMSQLTESEDYQDALKTSIARISYEDSQASLQALYKELNKLIDTKQEAAEKVKEDMFHSFNFLDYFVKLLGIALVVGGVLIALFTTQSITRPVKKLRNMLLAMGKGILPNERINESSDEVGEMGLALSQLIESMHRTTSFAEETGSGNFDAIYKPLSEHDTLGSSLLKMRDNLAQNERMLEKKVQERTEEVVRQKEEIETKNYELEMLYKQVTDSILYAKRIQEAILPPDSYIKSLLPQSFVMFKPKDIVSGDFYWIDKKDNRIYVSAVDCTGHGVPGAFMSLVGHNALKDISKNSALVKPAEILNQMRETVVSTLHADKDENRAKDGMDLALCSIDLKKMELQYAGAFNPLYLLRDGELIEIKANKFPIGTFVGDVQDFDNHVLELKKNDVIYLFSDGYADQFGGSQEQNGHYNGKKFMVGRFRKLIKKISILPIEEQHQILEKTLSDWQGQHEQVDDILVIGFRI